MYLPFNNFLFRTPLFSLNTFFQEMKKLERDETYWKQFLQDPVFQEAIFLASPVLNDEIGKYLSGYLAKEKDVEKLKNAVLRYFSRMCSRCTPFGLFAGFSLGRFEDEVIDAEGSSSATLSNRRQKAAGDENLTFLLSYGLTVLLPPISKYRRHTRLDMHYLCALAQTLGKQDEIQRSVKYYPNSSIYVLGDKLRYVEYFYRRSRRVHQISSVDFSEYIESLINFAKQGVYLAELVIFILQMLGEEERITADDATNFVKELIENQILVSELEPEITGKDYLFQVQRVLNENAPTQSTDTLSAAKNLEQLATLLQKMDSLPPGQSTDLYKEAEEIVKTTETAYEKHLLFQVDMYKPAENAVLNKNITNEILEAITFMNQITMPQRETTLKKFADSFYERYEEREMPLLQVMDVESGIGYPINRGDVSPLIENYFLPNSENTQNEIRWNQVNKILHKKLIDNYKTNGYTVEFTEKDFDFLKPNWDDLPQTISCMCEIFSTRPLIYLHFAAGSSAANLLGRFCHVDPKLEEYVKEITKFEASQEPDKIFAEIVHLPESRLGNILLHPVLREYEIPYLAKSSVSLDKQILPSDLLISVRHGKIVLRSQRLNKEIVPRLSTAHNYSNAVMPVYHFLCDLQTQGLRGGVGFNWGSLSSEFDFLPRAVYKNTILALATWKVKTEDFKKLIDFDKLSNHTEIKERVQQWRNERNISPRVTISEGDNDLLIDFENILSIKMLFSTIKKRQSFELQEFIFDMENAVIKDEEGNPFTNEFIITFQKNHLIHTKDAEKRP